MKILLFHIRNVFLLFVFSALTPSFSAPDLTIVGFFDPADGIGQVPITILECLGDTISTNFISTIGNIDYSNREMPINSLNAVNNPDRVAGKVALLIDMLWKIRRKPSDYMPKESIVKLAYSMFETTQIPMKWVDILNDEFDAVIVPDKYLINIYRDCGVTIPIFLLPIPMILTPYLNYPTRIHPYNPFVFGDASANKNPEILLEAFAKTFHNDPNVNLFMRAAYFYPSTQKAINEANEKYQLNTAIFSTGKISRAQFIDHVTTFDCYVNVSRGEGFSLIPREMLALGIPVIISNNTASTSICESGFVYAVPSTIKNPPNDIYQHIFGQSYGQQFDCSLKDVIHALQTVYENYEWYWELAQQGREWVKQYDCNNPNLQALYRTLIKPKHVVLGTENQITEEALITNSESLYQKYLQIAQP